MVEAEISIEIRPIRVDAFMEAAGALMQAHWSEIAKHRDVMVLKPDVDGYRQIESSGNLIALGAFDGGAMVGYCVSFFAPRHLHYADTAAVSNDILFVDRSRRLDGVGQMLMQETERIARDRGARMVFWHAKRGTTLDAMLFGGPYEVQDVVYGRVL